MDMIKQLATNLRLLMDRSGLDTQVKIAKASGVSQTNIGVILRGERTTRVDIVEKLAHALKVPTWMMLFPIELEYQQLKNFNAPSLQAAMRAYVQLNEQSQASIGHQIDLELNYQASRSVD